MLKVCTTAKHTFQFIVKEKSQSSAKLTLTNALDEELELIKGKKWASVKTGLYYSSSVSFCIRRYYFVLSGIMTYMLLLFGIARYQHVSSGIVVVSISYRLFCICNIKYYEV